MVVIGLDLGTTTVKALALEPNGQVVASATAQNSLETPQDGWVVQGPDSVWESTCKALREIAGLLGGREIAALALSGAMHSVFPMSAQDRPLASAMTWADGRTFRQARALRERGDAQPLYLRTGCPLQAIYHPAKLSWWREQTSFGNERFSSIKEYVLLKLSGEWKADFSYASTSGLLDLKTCAWDPEALSIAGVTPTQLPALVSPLEVAGRLNRSAAQATGLLEGLPIISAGSDGGLANVGAGAFEAGAAVITLGTSGAVRKVAETPILDSSGRTWCYYLLPGAFFAGGAINNGGLALQWLHDQLFADFEYRSLVDAASEVPPGAEDLLCLPYLTGERCPHWNPEARAVFHGLSLRHTRMHMARAMMEGVAFCLRDVWEAVGGGGAARITGGVTQLPGWMQIISDVLGVPLTITDVADASAVGAALVGHKAIDSRQNLTPPAEILGRISPDPRRHELYRGRHREFQELYKKICNYSASFGD